MNPLPSGLCTYFSKLLLLWSPMTSTFPNLVVMSQSYLYPTYLQHLMIIPASLKYFLLLACRIFSWFTFYSRDSVFSFSFDGSISYSSLLASESLNLFSSLSIYTQSISRHSSRLQARSRRPLAAHPQRASSSQEKSSSGQPALS